MAVTALSVAPTKPKFSPVEPIAVTIGRTGDPGTGAGEGTVVLQIFRSLGGNVADDPLCFTETAELSASTKEITALIDLKDEDTRRALIQTTEGGKFVLRGLLGKYYIVAILQSTISLPTPIKAGSPSTSKIQIVAISPWRFRTSFLTERVIAAARRAHTDIDPAVLETDTQIFIKNFMTDEELESALKRAESSVMSDLDTWLTPRRVITRPDLDSRFASFYNGQINGAVPPGYQETGRELPYHYSDMKFYGINQIPKAPIIEVERIRCVFASQVIYEFPREWISCDRYGTLNIMPQSGGGSLATFQNAFSSYTMFVSRAGGGLPKYFAVDFVYGLLGNEEYFDTILTMIAYRAAEEVLTFLGSANKPGVSSESRSTGGSSESFSYTQSAIYGFFSADVDYMRKQTPEKIYRIRNWIHGVEGGVV